MITLTPKAAMWIFGLLAIGGLTVFLSLYQSSPGPLAVPHAKVIAGNMIWSCRQCHTEDGLEAGCLSCHVEISEQYDSDKGFHAFLRRESDAHCETCHPEHHGSEFQLVSAVSWQGMETNDFSHPHVEFELTGKHEKLGCEQCHSEKLDEPFTLAAFPAQVRIDTMLGLDQACISCHRDIHESGDKTRDCAKCHNQEAFKPAPFFNHDQYYVLEGTHAKAVCTVCHQTDALPELMTRGDRVLMFGPVKGRMCTDCHESPHRLDPQLQGDCIQCHKGADSTWRMGARGVDVANHNNFGFVLQGAHMRVECAQCHDPGLKTYSARFPDPASADYNRRADQCSTCHQDPHAGQFEAHYASCTACHTVDRFNPSTIGPADHPESYPLLNGHKAVACIQCHRIDPDSEIRKFQGTVAACRDCHANPHGTQFDAVVAQDDCTACHASDFSDFRIREYEHQNMRAFFRGKGHAQAACIQCHSSAGREEDILQYRRTPTECAACHADTHRGQFRRSGETQCERCHGSLDTWTAERFDHEQDSSFKLGKAHVRVECRSCHLPAPQQDGQLVIQYRPLTTKCEDCHGFKIP